MTSPSTATSARKARPLQAALLLSAFYFIGKIIGLVQFAVIARLLNADQRDAYTAAFRLPDFVNYLVAGGAMSMTFIPIFTNLWQNKREREAWDFFSALATVAGGVLVVLIVLSCLAAHPLVFLFNPGLKARPEVLELATAMTRIVLPAQLFFYLGGMTIGVLNAHKRFTASGWTGIVYNVVAIAIAVLFLRTVGPTSFAWGILVGAFFGYLVVPLWDALHGPAAERLRCRVNFNWRSPHVRRFFTNALPIMIGVSFPVVDQLVVGLFASYLTKGTLFNLSLGNRAMIAPQAIVAQAASVAAFPYMASNSATNDWNLFSNFIRTGLCRLLFIALALSTLLILLSQPIINILFLHGGQYTASDAHETAAAFAFYCIGLFAWAGQQFVARGFYALQDTVTPTVIGSTITVVFFAACAIAVRVGAALGGSPGAAMALALVTSLGAIAHFRFLLVRLDQRLSKDSYSAPLNLARISGAMLRTGTACALMGVAGLAANHFVNSLLDASKLRDLLQIAITTVIAGGAFALAAEKFAIPEWFWLRDKILRRTRREQRSPA